MAPGEAVLLADVTASCSWRLVSASWHQLATTPASSTRQDR
jgi:hypothetical protein